MAILQYLDEENKFRCFNLISDSLGCLNLQNLLKFHRYIKMRMRRYIENISFKAIFTLTRSTSVLYFFIGLGKCFYRLSIQYFWVNVKYNNFIIILFLFAISLILKIFHTLAFRQVFSLVALMYFELSLPLTATMVAIKTS